jgi:CHASE2 domain-containing sensor protein
MKTIVAACMLLVSAAFAAPAWAMPFVPVGVAPGLVVQITGGCGRGFHRGPHGAC